jgi:tetratricopeptide (TPR) repeat protein
MTRMIRMSLLISLAVIAPSGVQAAVTVIGNSSARLCFQAAEKEIPPQQGQIEACDQALTQEVLSLEDSVATHVNRGILRSRKGDVAGGLADFDRASALNPNEPEAYLNKALVLTTKADQAREALPLFTVALQKKTRRPALAYYGRAAANEELGNLRSAYSDYTNALSADPNWDAPRIELARFAVRR